MCGRGERLALALARENINSLMEGSSQARVEVDVYELQKDSQYDTTDTSKCLSSPPSTRKCGGKRFLQLPSSALLTFPVRLNFSKRSV